MDIILIFGDGRQFFIKRCDGHPYSPSIGDKFKFNGTTFIINDIYWKLGRGNYCVEGRGLNLILYMVTKENCSLYMNKKLNELKFEEIDKNHEYYYKDENKSLSGEMFNFGLVKDKPIVDNYNFLD